MAKLINRLSEEQIAELPAIRDEWLGYGLSTAPADRAAAVEGVNDAYRAAGREPPPLVVWLRSPLEGVVGVELVQQLLKGISKRDQVWGQVWGQVRGQVWDQVRDQVWGQVRDQVWDQVRGQVG